MTNYVSRHDGKMLILSYGPTCVVESDVSTSCMRTACGMLTESTGIIHVPADRDQEAWARTIYRRRQPHVQEQQP